MSLKVRNFAVVSLLLVAFAATAQAQSQDYPNRQVRIIVASVAGGTVDTAARIMGQKLSEVWGQPVVIENKTGASEMIGADYVSKATPDGYTLILMSLASLTINPAVFTKLPYDAEKAFAPIASINVNPMSLVANPKVPYNTLKEMIALSKQTPKGISYSTPGLATNNHIAGEWLAAESGAKIVHVPYKGGPAAANGIIAGDVEFGVISLVQALPLVKAGSLKPLAITTEQRSALAPDWPSVAELLIPGYDNAVRSAIFAPANTPKPILAKINADVNKILLTAEIREKFAIAGSEPWISSSQELSDFIVKTRQRTFKIVTDAKIKAE